MKTLKSVFTVDQVQSALDLGETQTRGILMDIAGHLAGLEGITCESITSGLIVKSETAVRNRYVLILGSKIVVDTLWHDGSCDTESHTKDINARNLLRILGALELVHA